MWIYTFLISPPKKLLVSCYNLGVFEKDQGTHPKINEKQGAQSLVAIDIFIKKSISSITAPQKMLDFDRAILYLTFDT